MTEKEWKDKMAAARKYASRYNTRMAVRAHRWVSADSEHVSWEYTISPTGMPRQCFDRIPRPGGEHR